MKKLFIIAMIAGFFGSLYGASIGFGAQYTINAPRALGDTVNISYPSVIADVMAPILPILGARMGLVEYNIISEENGGNNYHFGIAVYGDLCLMLPLPSQFMPYIPVGIVYDGNGGSAFHFKGGVGSMINFGTLHGFLEGGVHFMNVDFETMEEGESDTYFYVQGGIRVPVGM